MPTSPQITISFSGTLTVKESEKNAYLSIRGFPLDKPVYDENGQPIYVKVPQLDMLGNPMLDENNDPIMVDSTTQVTEPMPETELMAEIIKQRMFMPDFRQATAQLEEMYGKLNYDAKQMLQYLSDNFEVSVVIE